MSDNRRLIVGDVIVHGRVTVKSVRYRVRSLTPRRLFLAQLPRGRMSFPTYDTHVLQLTVGTKFNSGDQGLVIWNGVGELKAL